MCSYVTAVDVSWQMFSSAAQMHSNSFISQAVLVLVDQIAPLIACYMLHAEYFLVTVVSLVVSANDCVESLIFTMSRPGIS